MKRIRSHLRPTTLPRIEAAGVRPGRALSKPLATALSLAAGTQAYAAVQWSGIVNESISDPTDFSWDIDDDGSADFTFDHSPSFEELRINPAVVGNVVAGAFYSSFGTGNDSRSFVNNLAGSQTIDSELQFVGGPTASDIFFNWSAQNATNSYDPFGWVSATGYLAVRFDIGGNDHFAWGQISRNPDGSGTLIQWAWEDTPGIDNVPTPLHIGSIPEPGTLAGMAIGAAALLAHRRRRRATAGS